MSNPNAIRLMWGAEEHAFFLGVPQWRRIDKVCDAGPGEIYRRLFLVASALEKGLTLGQAASISAIGDWRIDDMREVLLQGLIGGGLSEIQAADLVRRQVDDRRDFRANLALAFAVVKEALGDFEDAPPGEPTGEESPPSPEARSDGDTSTTTP